MRRTAIALALLPCSALTACGTQRDPPRGGEQPSQAAAQPVSLTDARNKKLDLKAPATKVVGTGMGRGREPGHRSA